MVKADGSRWEQFLYRRVIDLYLIKYRKVQRLTVIRKCPVLKLTFRWIHANSIMVIKTNALSINKSFKGMWICTANMSYIQSQHWCTLVPYSTFIYDKPDSTRSDIWPFAIDTFSGADKRNTRAPFFLCCCLALECGKFFCTWGLGYMLSRRGCCRWAPKTTT